MPLFGTAGSLVYFGCHCHVASKRNALQGNEHRVLHSPRKFLQATSIRHLDIKNRPRVCIRMVVDAVLYGRLYGALRCPRLLVTHR